MLNIKNQDIEYHPQLHYNYEALSKKGLFNTNSILDLLDNHKKLQNDYEDISLKYKLQKEENLQCNAQMQSRHLQKWCQLDDASRNLLEAAIRKLGLSARASDRILKVSRTIADLEAAETVVSSHIAEAIQYRSLDRDGWLG